MTRPRGGGQKVMFVGIDGSDLSGAAKRYMERYGVNYSVVRDIGSLPRVRGASPASPRRSSSIRRVG